MFFILMILCIAVSFGLDLHMQHILVKIMNSRRLWVYKDGDDFECNQELAQQQRNLFILGDPKLVMTIIQFMQFGYAIALSIVITYWQDFQKDEHPQVFHAEYYLIASIVCYVIFVYQMSNVIPRYTLCTNIGQLVEAGCQGVAVSSTICSAKDPSAVTAHLANALHHTTAPSDSQSSVGTQP